MRMNSVGSITVITGDKDGRTAAAFGFGLKEACSGRQIIFVAFGPEQEVSAPEFTAKLEPEIKLFRFDASPGTDGEAGESLDRDPRGSLFFIRKVMDISECDVLILVGMLDLVAMKAVTDEELKELLTHHGLMDVVLTGENVSPQIREAADRVLTVTA